MAAFYNAAWPIGEGTMTAGDRVNNFFESMLSLPIILLTFILHKIIRRTRHVRIDEIDVQTGRRDPVSEEVLEQERAEWRAKPVYLKIWNTLF